MMHNTKNYKTDNGDKWVVGGVLEILEEASVKGLPQAEKQADSTATDIAGLKNDFNDLLAKLKAAGLMSAT